MKLVEVMISRWYIDEFIDFNSVINTCKWSWCKVFYVMVVVLNITSNYHLRFGFLKTYSLRLVDGESGRNVGGQYSCT